MKAAIYARKSTLKIGQKETIENQIKICRREANMIGLEIVDVKTDAATGTDDLNRPEVKELINDAVNGKYDCVIMKGISRLYRDTEKGLGLIKKLDMNNIRVITVEEHFDSSLPENRTGTGQLDLSRITMYLMFAEMESKKLADRIKFTQIEKAHLGQWNQPSKTPYGYIYNSETKKLEVDLSKSEVVKLIFNKYLDGMGMKSIAHYLNGDNDENLSFPSPNNKLWSEYTIGFILKNEVYCGDVIYNKRSKKVRKYKNPEMLGKNQDDYYVSKDVNDEGKWIIKRDAHEPIIDKNIFDKVQEIMITKTKRKGVRNNTSLLAGIAKCGKCGKGMTFKRGRKNSRGHVVTRDNYYCTNYIRYGKQFCDSHHVAAKELEEVVLQGIKDKIEEMVKFEEVSKGISNKSETNLDKDIRKIQTNIDSLMHKMDILLDKNITGSIGDQQFNMANERYTKELNLLTNQLEKLKIRQIESSDENKENQRILEIYEEVKNIDNYSIENKRYLMNDLVEKVVIVDGDVDIVYSI